MINENFKPYPILTSERLTLRKLAFDDQHDIFALRTDAEINKYLDRAPSKTIENAIDFIYKVNENIEKDIAFYWAITFTDTKKFVGTICLFNFSGEKNSCEIGYELATEFQNQGIMKEAAQIVINYAFHTLKVRNILAFTHRDNQNSTKLLLKLNFVKSEETDKENPDLNIFTLTK